jgi:hypothetical protein
LAQSRGGTPNGERALQSARRIERCGWYRPASFGVPLPFFFLRTSWLEAKIVRYRPPPPAFSGEDRGGEREVRSFIAARDDDSGADRIARTRSLVSSAPAVAGEGDHAKHGGGGAGGEEILRRQEKLQRKRPAHRASAKADASRRRHFSGRRPEAAYAPSPLSRGGMKCVAV